MPVVSPSSKVRSQERKMLNNKKFQQSKNASSSYSLNRIKEVVPNTKPCDTLPQTSYNYNKSARKYVKLTEAKNPPNKFKVKMNTINENRGGSFDNRKDMGKLRSAHSRPKEHDGSLQEVEDNYRNFPQSNGEPILSILLQI